MTSSAFAIIKPGAEKSVNRKHPWIFSGAIQKINGSPSSGDTITVTTTKGRFVGFGSFSPVSQIRIRMWSFDDNNMIDEPYFRARIERAILSRKDLFESTTNAFRIINAESDGFPGLIVDRYCDFLVCQFLSAGVEKWKTIIVKILAGLMPVPLSGIYERSDSEVRQKEGLDPCTGVLWGDSPPDILKIQENGIFFHVNVKEGHKTGFYLDQRTNRTRLSHYVMNKRVLNCFSYTGGFGVYAAHGGASTVTNIDTSEDALTLLKQNMDINSFAQDICITVCDDVFHVLRKYRDVNEKFDVIILDPPKFAHTSHQVAKAARGYKDINLLAMKLINSGGYLFTFSCSGHITPEFFQKIISDAALDSNRDVHLVEYLFQPDDHPVAMNFPEGLYLKGLVCRIW